MNLLYQAIVFIIVHGTWGANTTWYVPGGDFFDILEKNAYSINAHVVPFRWSGSNSPGERKKAAHSLAKLIETYPQNTCIYVVAHSHGGTVGIIASHLVTKNKIAFFYAMGTPVNSDFYPNMDTIGYFYNLFSLEDLVQPVFGMFGRQYPVHERIANIRIFIDHKEPGHSDLHHPYVARWLPFLHNYLMSKTAAENVGLSEPSILYFEQEKQPVYQHDGRRQELIERDQRVSLLMISALRV